MRHKVTLLAGVVSHLSDDREYTRRYTRVSRWSALFRALGKLASVTFGHNGGNGGEAGIRTLGTLAGSPVFETGPCYAKTPYLGGFPAMVGNPYHLWYHLKCATRPVTPPRSHSKRR